MAKKIPFPLLYSKLNCRQACIGVNSKYRHSTRICYRYLVSRHQNFLHTMTDNTRSLAWYCVQRIFVYASFR